MLQRLAPGSIVLFGSRLNWKFVLDTVLVVESRTPYEVGLNDHELGVSDAFRLATLETLRRGTAAQLYRGVTYQDRSDDPFSFVPARPGEAPFSRPVIELPEHVTPELSQNFRATPASARQARSVWRDVVDQVQANGHDLAIHIEEPDIGSGEESTVSRPTGITSTCTPVRRSGESQCRPTRPC
ncbi:hypothetical protein [Actinomadura sp. DC4]|uniref:hypothetical protein n=1 Tax=Actinomadura sp. DC4 TaxID=3055069 RepID=UPI0025B1AA48|nr:hypothetical protein [Actinomadura sp. DC4]MDN3352056.1 hypothetical protein [Actinomadura sp. DC4]